MTTPRNATLATLGVAGIAAAALAAGSLLIDPAPTTVGGTARPAPDRGHLRHRRQRHPARVGGMPSRLNSPSALLAEAISRSPWNTLMVTAGWLSA